MVNYNKKFGSDAELETVKTTDVGNLEYELDSDMTAKLGSGTPTDPFIFEPVPNTPIAPLTEQDNAATVVCHSHLNVRGSADILSPVVAVLKSGDTVVVEDVRDDWTHIYTSSGIEGYSLSEYIVLTQVE